MKKRNVSFLQRLQSYRKNDANFKENQEEQSDKYVYKIAVSGGQVNIANDNGKVNAVVKQNGEDDNTSKEKVFRGNKKKDYITNWNNKLFLHSDNERNPLTLEKTFVMPDCGYRIMLRSMDFLHNDNLGSLIYEFVKFEKSSNMLITGVPGIGKSTITSWIANEYKNDENFIILRFRDWESEDLENGLLKSICCTLNCKKKNLENKIIILDGFDEMKALDIRMNVLRMFLNDIKDYENLKCIITSRPAYIDPQYFYNRIVILPFGINKIKLFYQKIKGVELRGGMIDDQNLDVLGVPVILYMAIMSNIDITKKTSKPELYSRIFAEKEGIFDRFCEYDSGSQVLRDPENVKKHLRFLEKVAFRMFENNDLQLQKDECEIPRLEFQGRSVSILEFPIKHLFENINPNIEFIHKSIYEYFVAKYIVTKITENERADHKKLAGILGGMLKNNKLTKEIIEFLKYKINKSEMSSAFEIVIDTFNLMLRDGMTYYTYKYYKKVHICEKNVFLNMLEIIHLWNVDSIKIDPKISDYLKYKEYNLNLECMDLRKVNLSHAYLRHANLQRTNLSREDFSDDVTERIDEDFIDLDLRGADLREADLRGRNISQVDFRDTLIREAIFDENQVNFLDTKYNLINTKVYIKETEEIIYYQEYKKRSRSKGKDDANVFIDIDAKNLRKR